MFCMLKESLDWIVCVTFNTGFQLVVKGCVKWSSAPQIFTMFVKYDLNIGPFECSLVIHSYQQTKQASSECHYHEEELLNESSFEFVAY